MKAAIASPYAAGPVSGAGGSLVAGPPGAGMTRRQRGIDGLRALAAGSVLVYHCWLYGSEDGPARLAGLGTSVVSHLASGVLLFFVLSGYLLYRPFADAILGGRPLPSTATYARNRFLRIVPAYVVVLLVIGVLFASAQLRAPEGDLVLGRLTAEPLVFLANLALVQNYHPDALLTGIGPAWTLVIEVGFYVTLPLVSVLGARAARGRLRRHPVAAALVAPVLLSVLGWAGKVLAEVVRRRTGSDGWGADWTSVLSRSFLANADLFAPGMLLAIVQLQVEAGKWALPRWWRAGAATLGGAILLATAVTIDGRLGTVPYDVAVLWGISLLIATALCSTTTHMPTRRGPWDWLDHRAVVSVGVASYGLFLWHEPLVRTLESRGWTLAGAPGFATSFLVVAAVAGGLATLTHRFVEAPALGRKRPMT